MKYPGKALTAFGANSERDILNSTVATRLRALTEHHCRHHAVSEVQ